MLTEPFLYYAGYDDYYFSAKYIISVRTFNQSVLNVIRLTDTGFKD